MAKIGRTIEEKETTDLNILAILHMTQNYNRMFFIPPFRNSRFPDRLAGLTLCAFGLFVYNVTLTKTNGPFFKFPMEKQKAPHDLDWFN